LDKKIAFIGTGTMGGALLRGACRHVDPGLIFLTDRMQGKAESLARELGCKAAATNKLAAEAADLIMFCVKPQTCLAALDEIGPVLRDSLERGKPKVLCSILSGVSIETIRRALGAPSYPVIRLMPNTPALIGKGLMLLAADETVPEADMADIEALIADCGVIERLDEGRMDLGTIVGCCSPAFVYQFIEALADSGVALGLTRSEATRFAAQAVMGAGAMVLETGEHPMALKDMVTSPGGSTIAGVLALESEGFRVAVTSAVRASYERNVQMGQLD